MPRLSNNVKPVEQLRLGFLLPSDKDLPSGGNIYNRRLISSLSSIGVQIQDLDLASFRECASRDCDLCFVDTLLLPEIGSLSQQSWAANLFLIVHFLPSFDPNRSQPTRIGLHAQEQNLLWRFSGFLVTSKFTGQLLRQQFRVEQPVIVVPPAGSIMPAEVQHRPEVFRGLMVSSLTRVKGVLEFLDALGNLAATQDRVPITIVGRDDLDPAYAEQCRRLAASHPILSRDVHLLGPVGLDQMSNLYASHSVFISASKFETFGMALNDADIVGLPILAVDGGAVSQHVRHGVNGYLFSSVDRLAETTVELAREPSALRILVARATAARPQTQYTWEDAARSLLSQIAGIRPNRVSVSHK